MFLKSSLSTLLVAFLATTTAAVPVASSSACPRDYVYSCCASVKSPTSDLTNALGGVVPLLRGVDITSNLGVSCLPMTEYIERGAKCGEDVMCCAKVSTVLGLYELTANAI